MHLSWAYGAGLCVFVVVEVEVGGGAGGYACCFAERLTPFKAYHPCGLIRSAKVLQQL